MASTRNVCLMLVLKMLLLASSSEGTTFLTGVQGGSVNLPCNLSDTEPKDLQFIVWKKNITNGTLILSYDVATQKQTPEVLKVHFRPHEDPPLLLIENLTAEDEGIYNCIIFPKIIPEFNWVVKLKVIIPPKKVEMFQLKDRNEILVSMLVPPVTEETEVMMKCRSRGGSPLPILSWYKDNKKIESSPEIITEDVVESFLTLRNVTRNDNGKIIACEARNTELSLAKPVRRQAALDVHYRPQNIEILMDKKTPLIANKEYRLQCKASGGHPPPDVTWWLGQREFTIPQEYVQVSGDSTTSTLVYTPSKEDQGKRLLCLAKTPTFEHIPIQDRIALNINYKPRVSLNTSTEGSPRVKENESFIMKCEVDSKPNIFNITWYHKQDSLEADPDKGITIRNNKLLLRPVTPSMSGKYSCVATNEVGDGSSNSLVLSVQHAPICANEQYEVVGTALNELVEVKCRVKSSPEVSIFRWEYTSKTTQGSSDISQGNFTSTESTSILKYTPLEEDDFGILRCWGTNELGEQRAPCTFNIIEAGLPGRLENCTVLSKTQSEVNVTCVPGHDGGLVQKFIINVRDPTGSEHDRNYSLSEPNFFLKELTSDTDYLLTLYSANKKGNSEARLVRVRTSIDPQGIPSVIQFPVTPIIAVLIGVVSALVFVSVLVVIVMKLRSSNGKKGPNSSVLHTPLRATDGENDSMEPLNDPERQSESYPKKLRHANLYEASTSNREDKSTQHCCTFA